MGWAERAPSAVAAVLLTCLGTAFAAVGGLVGPFRVVPARASAAPARPKPAPTVALAPPPLPAPTGPGTVQNLLVPSPDAPGGRRPVWVYRPAVPDSAELPVLYFLHGLPGSSLDLQEEVDLSRALDRAFLSAGLPPFVVAAPDGNSVGARDPEWADSVKGHVRLETFVTGPLIEAVEGSNLRDPRHRAIAGFSMGGYGAMNLAERHPDLYGQVASLAGYFHVDDPSRVFGRRPGLEAANSPDQHAADLGALRVFLAVGSQDDQPVVSGETRRFAGLLDSAGHPPSLHVYGGGHSWDLVRAELPQLEAFLEDGWATRPAWDHPDF